MLSVKSKEERYVKKRLQVGRAVVTLPAPREGLHGARPVKCQLEGDALKIINGRLGTRYRSLKQVSLEEIIKLSPVFW